MQRKRVELTRIFVDGIEVDAKECSRCGVIKALTDFSKSSDGSVGGRQPKCKTCKSNYYKENHIPKRVSPLQSIKGTLHRKCFQCGTVKDLDDFHEDRTGIAGRKSYCKQCCSEKSKNRRIANPEKYKYIDWRRWHFNKESESKRKKVYYSAEKNSMRWKSWFKSTESKFKVRVNGQNRRTRKQELPDCTFNVDIRECFITRVEHDVQLDHFIALKTGHGGTYVGNLIPLISQLNSSKKNRNPFEWIRTRPDIDANRFDAVVAYLAGLNGLTLGEYKQFVDWCYANPRTIDEIKRDNDRYGYVVSSLELWRVATGAAFPIRIDFRNPNEKEASA